MEFKDVSGNQKTCFQLLVLVAAVLICLKMAVPSRFGLEGSMSMKQLDTLKMTSDLEFEERRLRVERICSTNRVTPKVNGEVFADDETGLLYCIIPKTGCTFWKLFFKSIKKNRTSINNMQKLWRSSSKAKVHTSGAKSEKYNRTTHNSNRLNVRFMVTRDPFSRLVSTYLDKAYLPDFWRTHMANLVNSDKIPIRDDNDFLRRHFDDIAARFEPGFKKGVNTTYGHKNCAKYLTFNEYVTTTMLVQEEHERPLHQLCNPCRLNITHISRMNTFTADARGILSKASLDHVLDDWDNSHQMEEELQIILDYNFGILNNRKYDGEKCASWEELALRLFNNFRWKGFILPSREYTFMNKTTAKVTSRRVRAHLEKQLKDAMAAGRREPEVMKKAKKDFRKFAFRSLSDKTLGTMMRRHSLDIQLFGFEKERNEVISWVYDKS